MAASKLVASLFGMATVILALLLGLCGSLVPIGPANAQTSASPPTVAGEKSPPATNGVAPTPAAANLKDAATGLRKSSIDCAGGEDLRRLSASANSPSIVYNAKFVPALSTVDFGIPGVSDADGYYFALLTDDNAVPHDDSRHRARVRKAAPYDDLVIKQLLSPGETIVSLDVAMDAASWWWWAKRNLYIYQCSTGRRPINVSYAPVYIRSSQEHELLAHQFDHL